MINAAARQSRPLALFLALAFGGASALTTVGPGVFAQNATPGAVAPAAIQNAGDLLTQPQIEQLLAPIALYPDDLLMQVLMASTYPLEIVQAKRWLGQGQNAALAGDGLANALIAQPWDPSVKSLTPFPDVLGMMNDQLEWTQQLGDALLEQQDDVMNAIQVLRGRARANGMLTSGPQQAVTVTQNVNVAPAAGTVVAPPAQIIVIAPTQPERVYVPVYDPSVAFGAWPHPGYPPTYFPPPPSYGLGTALLTGLAFAGGVAVVGSLWGWARPGWGGGGNSINVNANRYNNINVNRTQINNNNWRHDSSHRQGVAYRNQDVSNRYRGEGQRAAPNRDAQRDQFRGRVDSAGIGGGERAGARPGQGAGDRPGGADRPGQGAGNRPGGGDRPGQGAGDRPGVGDRPGQGAGNRPGGGDRPGQGAGDRPGGGDRPGQGAGDRPAGGDRPGQGAGNRPGAGGAGASGRPQVQRPAQTPTRQAPAGLQGAGQGQGRDARASSQRGQASRQAQARPQSGGGGGARAGGGGRSGGGGQRGGR